MAVSPRLIVVGAFVLGGALLFATGLFLIGDRRGLFADNFEVYAEFSRLSGLENGATVRVAGLDSGEVTGISVPTSPRAKFRVRVRIREDMHGVVRSDSVASIQTEGLVGNKFIQIEGGSEGSPRAPADSTIRSREPFDMADLLQQMSDTLVLINQTITELKGDVMLAIETVTDVAGEARDLIAASRADIDAITKDGRRVAQDMRTMMDDVAAGRGTVGRLFHDDGLYRDARRIASEAGKVVANLRQVSEQARQTIENINGRINQKEGPAQGLASDLRQAVAHARDAMADLADDAEALKRNFLFRGFFNRRGYFDLDDIGPTAYRSGALAGDDRRALRIWLGATGIFDVDPQGAERLSADGRARLDSAMSQFLSYPPTSPLVIEGYADEPTADARYLVSRRRASLVRDYLTSRFSLDVNRVGLVALGNEPPRSADRPDTMPLRGVALALFINR